MTFRKVFTTIMCIALIISPNLMVNAAIEGEDGNGLLTGALYVACVAGCWGVGYFTAETTTMACIAACSAIGIAKGDEGDGSGGGEQEQELLFGKVGQ